MAENNIRETQETTISNALAESGLSNEGVQRLAKVGAVLNRIKPFVLPTLAGAGYLGEVAANAHLHAAWGIPAVVLSPLNFSPAQVDGQTFFNGLLALSHGTFVLTGLGAVGEKVGSWAKGHLEKMGSLNARKEGRAPNEYPSFALMRDLTNQAEEGSVHGDFYQELYRELALQPDKFVKILRKVGPITEIVPHNSPIPADVPPVQYFRSTNPANTNELKNLVKADRATLVLSVLLNRNQTVWDKNTELSIDWQGSENMGDTITKTLKNKGALKFAIISDRVVPTHGAFNIEEGKHIASQEKLTARFEQQGYEVIKAEKEVMDSLIGNFKKKGYKKILIIDDATDLGESISNSWANDYQASTENDKPEIVKVSKENLTQTLESGDFDAIFMIGGEDLKVAAAAIPVLREQKEGKIKKVPLEVLLEGRGSIDALSEVEETGGNLHFVHEILAKSFIDRLSKKIGI